MHDHHQAEGKISELWQGRKRRRRPEGEGAGVAVLDDHPSGSGTELVLRERKQISVSSGKTSGGFPLRRTVCVWMSVS